MQILYRMKYGLLSALLVLAANSVSGQIQLSFSTTSPTCNGYTDGTATVTATGGAEPYSYQWDNGQSGQTNFGLGAGTVFVTVTDQNGLTATGSTTVTQPDQLDITFDAEGLSCTSSTGTLTANVTGGVQPYTYNWSSGQTTSSISVSSPGTYILTVTDANQCSVVEAYNVLPAVEIFPSYSINSPLCFGLETGSIGITIFGTNPPFTWTWSNGVQNLPLTNVAGGDYGITITDATGCSVTDTVTLAQPPQLIVEITATNSPCATLPNGGNVSANVSGGTNPYTYVWDNGNNNPGQQGVPPGTYSVTVYDIYGCTASDTATLTLPPPLTGEVVSISPACNGNNGCITVQGVGGTPPYTYVWPALGINGPTACGLGPGTYYVCIFDANGCQHDLMIDMYSIDSLDVTLILTKAECPGVDNGTATAIVNPPGGTYSYDWLPQPNPNTSQINSLAAGTVVSVTVTDINTGCMGTASGIITSHNAVVVNVTDTDVTCVGDSTGSATALATGGTNPYDYVWTLPDSSTVNGPNITGLGVGAYAVSVTDSKGCTAIGVADIGALSNPVANYLHAVTVCDSNGVTVQISDTSTDPMDTIVAWNWNISWSNGDTTSTQQNPPLLFFEEDDVVNVQLTVTSSKGCTAVISSPFAVTGVPSFSLNVPNPVVDCDNEPVNIIVNGAPGNTYTWIPTTGLTFNPNAQNVIADPDTTTEYQLIVSSGLCADTADVTVVRVAPIDLAVQDSAIVTCDSLATLVAFTNSAANATVVWLNNEGDTISTAAQVIVQTDSLDIYTVVATDPYGCSQTANVSVTGPDAAIQALFGSQYAFCATEARIQFTDSTTHLTPIVSWDWTFSSGQTSDQQNPLITFTFEETVIATLTVEDENGCVSSYSAPIEVKVVNDTIVEQQQFCPGEAVALNPDFNPNYVYQWVATPADTSFNANSPNPTVMPAVPTMYVATIGNGPCSVIDSITVTPQPAATVELPQDTLLCSGEQYTLTALNTNGVTFVWSESPTFTPELPSDGGSLTITPKKNGVYYIKAINAAECEAIDSVKVNNAEVDIDAEPANRMICLGDSTELVVTNLDPEDVLTYEWTPNLPPIPNPTVSPTEPSTYTVLSTNQFGCADTMQFNVNVINIAVTAENTGKDTICPGQETELLATVTSNSTNITYEWEPSNSLDNANIPNPIAAPTETTEYTVTAVAENLCPDTAKVTVYFMSGECAEPYIFVPKAFTPNGDSNNDFFIVRGLDIKEVYFVVWDRWGEKVYETTDPAAQGWDGTYNGKQLTPDSYAWFVRVTCGNGEFYENKGDVTLLK